MKTGELKELIRRGEYDGLIKDIYVDPSITEKQKERYLEAVEKFEELYGEREVSMYSAPGRTEIGGNHTDHQHGRVLAASVNMDIIAVVEKTDDNIIKVLSGTYDINPVDIRDLEKRKDEEGTSEALIRGVIAKLCKDGYNAGGFRAYMTSEVLRGSGLSSSAAFEVIIVTIASGLYNDMKISPVYIAQAAQYAENEYFGKPCGLMDQMASSVGSLVYIDFKDPNSPVVRKIEVDFEKFGYDLCIVDTKGDHSDLTGEYAAIPREMKKVAGFFGKEVLREVDEQEFYSKIPEIKKQSGDRAILRAIHFFDDNERVGRMTEALEKDDFELFKKLITESGNSSYKYLQNVFAAVDTNHQNMSIALALSEKYLKDHGAYRVHGGGFAGTIQAFVPKDEVAGYKDKMEKCFGKGSCHVLRIRKYGGMKIL